MRLFHTTQSAERIIAEGFRAALLNRYAQVRLLDQAEVDALPKIATLSDKSLGAPPRPCVRARASEVVLTPRIALTPGR